MVYSWWKMKQLWSTKHVCDSEFADRRVGKTARWRGKARTTLDRFSHRWWGMMGFAKTGKISCCCCFVFASDPHSFLALCPILIPFFLVEARDVSEAEFTSSSGDLSSARQITARWITFRLPLQDFYSFQKSFSFFYSFFFR